MRRSAAGLSRKSVLCCGVKAKIAGYGVLHYHFKKQFMELPADAQDAACKQGIDALARVKAMMEQQMPK
ncbi:DUF5339 family protein [Morganella morganii]|uniref:DUF5339 family protein n=1 Tax=Morganella morganii TaxID=582 RepID=UPI0031A15BD0